LFAETLGIDFDYVSAMLEKPHCPVEETSRVFVYLPVKRLVLMALPVLSFFLASNGIAGQTVHERERFHAPFWRLAQTAGDVGDVPLLPCCPGGLPVPLPPGPGKEESLPVPLPAVDGSNLTSGTGYYKGMIRIPAGPFEMGSPEGEGRADEHPIHTVFVKEFYIARHDVTVQEFANFLNAKGLKSRDGSDRTKLDSPDCPVVKDGKYIQPKPGCAHKPMTMVSWYAASEFAQWAGGRLPTSAEWEKAAVLSTPFRPGDYLTILTREGPVRVSLAVPGVLGVTGMVGNVWQWCSDWYDKDYYASNPASNPAGPAVGKEKIVRGGSWASPETSQRLQNIHRAFPGGCFSTVGFRLVKD